MPRPTTKVMPAAIAMTVLVLMPCHLVLVDAGPARAPDRRTTLSLAGLHSGLSHPAVVLPTSPCGRRSDNANRELVAVRINQQHTIEAELPTGSAEVKQPFHIGGRIIAHEIEALLALLMIGVGR